MPQLAGKHTAHFQSQHKYVVSLCLPTWEKQQEEPQFLYESYPQIA